MRFPSFYADLYESLGALDETPFGTNFLVKPVQPDGTDAPALPEEVDPPSPEALTSDSSTATLTKQVLLPLELTGSALPPEQLEQELQALTRLNHPGILAPTSFIEREHHHTQKRAFALVRPYIHGEPLLRYVSKATLSFDSPPVDRIEASGEEPETGPDTQEALTSLSEDTDEVSLIISEVSRSDRYEGIAPLGTRLVRLVKILPAMVDALGYLHRYKRYHGALSPGCIFIDASYTPHISDAGLWQMLRGQGSSDDSSLPPASMHASGEHRLRQVNLYRAPELFLGAEPSAEADLYSLGCLLFHALCGEPPFLADAHDQAHRHIHAPRPSVLAYQPHCPSAWIRLIHDLMQVEPTARPTIEQLAARVKALPDAPTPLVIPTPPRPTSFCGRPELLDELEALARESRTRRVIHPIVLTGAPGQGKHYFIDHLIDRLTRQGWLVLRGRCYAQSFDPYRGWRYLIDDLVALLAQAPPEVLAPLEQVRRTAATLFPSLHPDRAPDLAESGQENTSVQRLEATLALRALFDMLSHRRPLLIAFDDIHLATRDTLELLHDVLANDTPFEGMLLVTSAPGSDPIFPERDDDAHTHLDIPALAPEEAHRLLESLGTARTIPHITPLLDYDATHAPQLIKELVHEFHHSHEEEIEGLDRELTALLSSSSTHTERVLRFVLERRHAKLEHELSVSILNVLSLHAGPLSLDVLDGALSHLMAPTPSAKERDTALTLLATLRLVKRVSLGRYGTIHYRISGELCRTLVREMMDGEQLMLTHSALSKALTQDTTVSTTQIFEHARRAGRIREAKRLADAARLEAVAQLAFSRAAEIQSWLVEQRKETSEAQRQELAELETASGQHREAALLWQKMAEEKQEGLERVAALCEASEAWFYAGEFDEALAMQEQALHFFGQHYAPTSSQNRWNALKLWWSDHLAYRPEPLTAEQGEKAPELPEKEALRARVHELLLQTSLMLNTSQAPTFARRLRRLGLTHRAPGALAHAYQHQALLMLELDLRRAKKRARGYLEQALVLFARERDFAKQAEVNVTQAHLAQSQGQWEMAHALYSSAEELWRASSATTRMARVELDYRRGLLALWQGDLDEAGRMIESLFYEERHLAPAQVRGHQLASQRALLSGQIEDAAEHLHHISKHLTRPGISILGLWHIEQTASLHIARGEPEVALGRLDLARSMYQDVPLHHAPRVRMRLAMKTAQALCALITRDFYTDRARRGELLKRTGSLVSSLKRQQDQMTTVEVAEFERLRMRHLWLAGKPRKALKTLDLIDAFPSATSGKFALMVQRELRGLLLQAIDQPEAETYLEDARLAYAQLGYYAPLVQEGWPFWASNDEVQRDQAI